LLASLQPEKKNIKMGVPILYGYGTLLKLYELVFLGFYGICICFFKIILICFIHIGKNVRQLFRIYRLEKLAE
jgi:hypothetical protein